MFFEFFFKAEKKLDKICEQIVDVCVDRQAHEANPQRVKELWRENQTTLGPYLRSYKKILKRYGHSSVEEVKLIRKLTKKGRVRYLAAKNHPQ